MSILDYVGVVTGVLFVLTFVAWLLWFSHANPSDRRRARRHGRRMGFDKPFEQRAREARARRRQ